MADAKSKDRWWHTSTLLAKLHNMFADTPLHPSAFDPHRPKSAAKPVTKEHGLFVARAIFCPQSIVDPNAPH